MEVSDEVALPPCHRSTFSFGFFGAASESAAAGSSASGAAPPAAPSSAAAAAITQVAVVDPRGAAWASLPALSAAAAASGALTALRSVADASVATASPLAPMLADERTDIIPGVYEGGLKEWEASHDLVRYVESAYVAAQLSVVRVLELGCGHGLPGIAALRQGAAVAFTDLNVEVLTSATLPNALLNAGRERVANRAFFVSGDWADEELLRRLLSWRPRSSAASGLGGGGGGAGAGDTATVAALDEGRFSLILSAETVYTAEALEALHALIARTLAPGGVALAAAKRYYFGLGGGTRALCEHAAKLGILSARVVAVTEERNVVREIVELRLL